MSLLPPLTARVATDRDYASAILDRETTWGQWHGLMLEEGWWNSIPGQVLTEWRVPGGALDDLTEQRLDDPLTRSEERGRLWLDRGGEAAPERDPVETGRELDARGIDYLTQEQWEASPYYREGMPYEPFTTAPRAAAMAEVYDRNAWRRHLLSKRDASGLDQATGFVAAMIGTAPDPTNLFALGALRAAWALRAATAAGRVGRTAAVGALEGGAATAIQLPFLAANQRRYGDDLSWGEALLEISLGAALGATIGGGVKTWQERRSARYTERTDAAAAGRAAVDALPQQRVTLPEVQARAADVQRAVAEVEATGDLAAISVPEPTAPRGADVRRPETLTEFLAGRGLRDDAGELTAIGADDYRPKGYKRLVREEGADLDTAREAAVEAGYLPEDATVRDLLDAIDDDMRGSARYSERDLSDLAEYQDRLSQRERRQEFVASKARLKADAKEQFPREFFTDWEYSQAVLRAERDGGDPIDALSDVVERRAMQEGGFGGGRAVAGEDIPFDVPPAVEPNWQRETQRYMETKSAEAGIEADGSFPELDQFEAMKDAGLLTESELAEFEAVTAEWQRMKNIEGAYDAAALCVVRAA